MIRWLVPAVCLAACGDNATATDASPDVSPAFLASLSGLPGVHDVTEKPTQQPGYHYFVLHFTQPVDHADPGGQTFLQEVSLLHKDTSAPMIVQTSGYWDYYLDSVVELTSLLAANQISIEHRFFASSRPDPADWTKLTIEQMAEDEHAIVTAFQQLYTGKYLATGGSKGGMTAIFYRRFFPDDVAGTVPYVAPISFGAPDTRYPPFLASVGSADCHQKTKDLAVEMLSHHRAALEQRAQAQAQSKGYAYSRIAIGPAVESAIISFEWSFWQYFGITQCSMLPELTASDDDLFHVLDVVSPPSDNNDTQIGLFDAYYFQAYFQLGYPADGTMPYLGSLELYTDADYANSLPTAQPAYDGGAAMTDIASFVAQTDKMLFVYGEWDPWTGGAFDLGGATDSLKLFQSKGTHNSQIVHLSSDDEHAAFAKLEAWTGVAPKVAQVAFALVEPARPHVPPALLRALRLH